MEGLPYAHQPGPAARRIENPIGKACRPEFVDDFDSHGLLSFEAPGLEEGREIDQGPVCEIVGVGLTHDLPGGGNIFAGEVNLCPEELGLAMVDAALVPVGHIDNTAGQTQPGGKEAGRHAGVALCGQAEPLCAAGDSESHSDGQTAVLETPRGVATLIFQVHFDAVFAAERFVPH